MPGYIYAVKGKDIYVNLFVSNEAVLDVAGKRVDVKQTTNYPWNGEIRVEVSPQAASTFGVKIRIPGWVRNEVVPGDLYRYVDNKRPAYRVTVNGQAIEETPEQGYIAITRRWKRGDVVEVRLDMEPRIVRANPRVEADRGRVAVERGPIVYCAEWPDNHFGVRDVLLDREPHFEATYHPDLLKGVVTLTTAVRAPRLDEQGKSQPEEVSLTLIPYYAWAHRGPGEMAVWLHAPGLFE
jgi:DUF1680 family protein